MSSMHDSQSQSAHEVPRRIIPFTAAVLAGGRSLRMGTDKSFLRVGDETLLQRQLRCLHELSPAEVLVSGRADTDYSAFDTRVICDERPHCGPLAGIAAVLTVSRSPMVLVLAVDMPAMNPAMLRKLLATSSTNLGCIPIDDTGWQPLAAVYPKTALPLAEQQLASRNFSMQAFVQAAMDADMVGTLTIDPAEIELFANWNRLNDWTPSQT